MEAGCRARARYRGRVPHAANGAEVAQVPARARVGLPRVGGRDIRVERGARAASSARPPQARRRGRGAAGRA
jgi:hypothetical protein